MKSSKGETVTFTRPFTGIVESVIDKGTPNEKYVVRTERNQSLIIYPKDIIDSGIALRRSKLSKKPVKRDCGCK